MIISKLSGGLGNQMFQYAAGRAVAYRLNTELKLDISGFETEGVTKREYGLGVFNIIEKFASRSEISRLRIVPSGILKYSPRLPRLLEGITGRSHIIESEGRETIFGATDESYIEGTWNSERYFEDIKDIIRQEFTQNKPLDLKNKKIICQIKKCNAVSVHVRRGDYVNNPKVKANYVSCSLDYYNQAIDLIKKKVKDPYFFVFSDDPTWVRENFKSLENVIFVLHNVGAKSYLDLKLMSCCVHNIIANSTFSWWSAWLNKNPNKFVVSPNKWMKNSSNEPIGLKVANWSYI